MYLLSGEPAPHCRIVANVTHPRRQDADPARPLDFAWPQPESEPEPTYGRDTKCSRGTAAEDNGG